MDKRMLNKITLPNKRELRSTLMVTVAAVFLIYMVVSTIQTFWQNYRIDRELARIREENAELKLHNQYLQNLIAYRKTESFQDKEARSKLNYQKPGELVLIIPEEDVDRFREGNIKDQPDAATSHTPSNPEKWWQFLFRS